MRKPCERSALSAMLLVCVLSGCASSPPSSPPLPNNQVKLTPLPASLQNIDFSNSERWKSKAADYSTKRERLFESGIPK